MPATAGLLSPSQWADVSDGLRQLRAIPPWLAAALDADQVVAALNRHVPEFASGALALRGCAIDLLHLKNTDGAWERNWLLTVADGQGERRIPIRVTLSAPAGAAAAPPAASAPIESSDWRCWLPELGLLCKPGRSKKSKDFPALGLLTDGESAGRLLEQALRAHAPGYQDVSIQSCQPELLHNKPGKSAVIRYRLGYGPAAAGRGWRDTIILKLYGDDAGASAFAGMRAVWDAGLQSSPAVRIPEPLAYLADMRATVQGPVPEERDLERLLRDLLLSDDPADQAALRQAFRATGAALAAFHRSGGRVESATSWGDAIAEAAAQLDCLRVPFPDLIAPFDRLVERLRALAAELPAGPSVPSHGAFRPEQVLLAGGQIGFIDFDSFCMAEPAFDLALFRASAMDSGLYDEHLRLRDQAEAADRRARIDALNEEFLAAYEAHAPVSRRRVALWEAIFYLNDSLQCWTKPRPNDARLVVGLLERHLRPPAAAPGADRGAAAPDIAAGLARLGALPDWLLAPLQGDRVAEALRRAVPEIAGGALALLGCKIKRMLLKDDGRWAGTYSLTVADAGGKRALALRGSYTPPSLRGDRPAPAEARAPFGVEGWALELPDLGLELEPEPPEADLPALPLLTDPAEARALLEQGIRAGSAAYADLRIAECVPTVLSYKPGSRCTLRYQLAYPPELADRGWPTEVIAKTYRKDSKGRNAYDGMLALWGSPLAAGGAAALAEPLAYIPGVKVLVQGPVAGARSLEDLLKDALAGDGMALSEQLHAYVRKAAAGLAALHRSGVSHGAPIALGDRFAEIRALAARLVTAVPALAGAVEPLLSRLEALAAASPPDALVPTHGTFNPEQVLIDGPRIGLIDFDDFCMAEPALDVGLFRAAIKDIGLNALDPGLANARELRVARLARLDAIGAVFLDEYERHAPISRQRVALWEAWSYLRDALHYWIKVKPAEPDNGLLMLESHLRDMGLIGAATPRGARPARQRAAGQRYRHIALVGVLAANAWLSDLADVLELVQALL